MDHYFLFYFVFLGQVLLISLYLPNRMLSRLRYLVETYPPADYPRLYPVPMPEVERTQRLYKRLNGFALLVGLALFSAGVLAPTEDMLNWDTISVLGLYWALQMSPLLVAMTPGFTYFNLKRQPDSRTTRSAALRPRRLFDFVSPAVVGLAVGLYLAFAYYIHYLRRFDYPWFGGYWNIAGITALNVLFAVVTFRYLFGRKSDPYQADEDRLSHIGHSIRLMVTSSILATLYVSLAITLRAFDLHDLSPVFQSLYLQLVAVLSFFSFRIHDVNFEVYRQDPQPT